MNLFAYAGGNPVMNIDRRGLSSTIIDVLLTYTAKQLVKKYLYMATNPGYVFGLRCAADFCNKGTYPSKKDSMESLSHCYSLQSAYEKKIPFALTGDVWFACAETCYSVAKELCEDGKCENCN